MYEKIYKHGQYTSDAEKLALLNHRALKYCEHYACQRFLWMPLKMSSGLKYCLQEFLPQAFFSQLSNGMYRTFYIP